MARSGTRRISDLIDDLKARGRNAEGLHAALAAYAPAPGELDPYLLFSAKRYTRNLIFRNDDFELMTLCWEPGQRSPIHDHGAEGWMLGLRGGVEEIRYRADANPDGTLEMVRLSAATLGPGMIGHINDSIALHSVGNASEGRSVSLHLYSPPIDACNYYIPETRRYKLQQLSFYSVDGVVGKAFSPS